MSLPGTGGSLRWEGPGCHRHTDFYLFCLFCLFFALVFLWDRRAVAPPVLHLLVFFVEKVSECASGNKNIYGETRSERALSLRLWSCGFRWVLQSLRVLPGSAVTEGSAGFCSHAAGFQFPFL